MQYNRIKIYLRQTGHNKINSTRPTWFNYEKTFANLLSTINYNITDLTVVFDGSKDEFESHFTKKYQSKYNFRHVLIDSKSYSGTSYEQNCGSSKSGALTSEVIKNDNLSEDCIIGVIENDYCFRHYWCDVLLDVYNNIDKYSYRNPQIHYVSLYDHTDTYLMINPNSNNEYGMYKDLKSKIVLGPYCYWRYLPLITSTWFFTKYLFDRDYEYFRGGYSDNTHCDTVAKKHKTYFIAPMPGFCCHQQLPWISPFIDWKKIIDDTIMV